jgi:hypothetical protein
LPGERSRALAAFWPLDPRSISIGQQRSCHAYTRKTRVRNSRSLVYWVSLAHERGRLSTVGSWNHKWLANWDPAT